MLGSWNQTSLTHSFITTLGPWALGRDRQTRKMTMQEADSITI